MTSFKISPALKHELLRIACRLEAGYKVRGYRRYHSVYRKLSAFYNKGLGIVVKRHESVIDHKTPTCLRAPTIPIGLGWYAQPILRKTELRKAFVAICRKLRKHKGIYPDLHIGNVGWYNSTPLMFDW
jgi:hypothetical protein